jgi:hypothetical protein
MIYLKINNKNFFKSSLSIKKKFFLSYFNIKGKINFQIIKNLITYRSLIKYYFHLSYSTLLKFL